MARKPNKSNIEQSMEKLLEAEEERLLKDFKPADFLRLLQLRRELKEPKETQRPKEIVVRWIDSQKEE